MGGRRGRAFRVKEEEGLGMESLAEHYERLLGLDDDWQVLDVVVANDITAHLGGTSDRLTVNWHWVVMGLKVTPTEHKVLKWLFRWMLAVAWGLGAIDHDLGSLVG